MIIEDLATGTVLVDHTDALYDRNPSDGGADADRSAGCRTLSMGMHREIWAGAFAAVLLGMRRRGRSS